ncbi:MULTISPECIES: CRISPR-associated helicase Cas3' [Methylococcus]|uniref:CRISPR-associated helicase Cas3 n=1 Tax=Methylococcus capsulatus TaxID=414 RepID=A0ABZ2F9T7_METCP|nr:MULTISPECIES: CRISPR-associated helicase Cas3' [Methylococcus]
MRKDDSYAHSANRAGIRHRLRDHLASVSRLAGEFAGGAPWADEARLAGLLHDLGKYGDRFQARLRGEDQGLDHWSQGAWLALSEYKAIAAALAIQGHHIGLQYLSTDGCRGLELQKLTQNHPLQLSLSSHRLDELKARLAADGLMAAQPRSTVCGMELDSRIDRMLDIRLLFSALVDADFLDTEAHFEGDQGGKRYRPPGLKLEPERALPLLLAEIERLQAGTRADARVAEIRSSLHRACLEAAEWPQGLFTLTAPTGSGKTLAMLAFALKHAKQQGLRRVVMVIPYLSIIEQTARIYRDIFAPRFGNAYVLEHHSLTGGGAEPKENQHDNEGHQTEDPERRRRLLAENWDAPLIVTTSVQMLESLFANRPSTCRKLHRLAGAVILFDEVQTLPANLAVPTLAALSHLAQAHGSTVVFATATQPAFTHLHETVQQQCAGGWQPREIVPEPSALFTPLKRVTVEWGDPGDPLSWQVLAERLRQPPQVLCIVNLKRHAKELWTLLQEVDALHLSTNLCPAHRRDVLATVRQRLERGAPVRLIATQCIEAGVDVDFPVVYRAYAPLDAIIQAAGRCNREGKREALGQVYVFMPEDERYPPGGYEQAAKITQMRLKRLGKAGMVIDDPEFITAYYRELYDISRPETAKKACELLDFVRAGAFPEIAQTYRLIEQDTINVVVPYAARLDLFTALQEMADTEGLNARWIKKARPLSISLFRPKADDPVWDGLIPVQNKPQRGKKSQEDWFIATVPEHYHPQLGYQPPTGLNLWIA